MKIHEQRWKNHHILYDAQALEQVTPETFDPVKLKRDGAVTGIIQGRGDTFIIRLENFECVLRHYRRGGLIARLSNDRYLWGGLQNTRAWREWRLLAELYQQGLPVPHPIAAQVVHHGLTYTADILTERLPQVRPLSDWLSEQPLSQELWREIGRCIARFHLYGVYHADLNAHNVLIDNNDKVYLIDFDRGELRAVGAWQQDNLARFRRSLEKLAGLLDSFHFQQQDWDAMLEAYTSLVSKGKSQ
jgi:3-deoxy-D-manno-octulosonic acid kinase